MRRGPTTLCTKGARSHSAGTQQASPASRCPSPIARKMKGNRMARMPICRERGGVNRLGAGITSGTAVKTQPHKLPTVGPTADLPHPAPAPTCASGSDIGFLPSLSLLVDQYSSGSSSRRMPLFCLPALSAGRAAAEGEGRMGTESRRAGHRRQGRRAEAAQQCGARLMPIPHMLAGHNSDAERGCNGANTLTERCRRRHPVPPHLPEPASGPAGAAAGVPGVQPRRGGPQGGRQQPQPAPGKRTRAPSASCRRWMERSGSDGGKGT